MRLDEFERKETDKLRRFMAIVEDMIAGTHTCEGIAGVLVDEFLPLLRRKTEIREEHVFLENQLEKLTNDVIDRLLTIDRMT